MLGFLFNLSMMVMGGIIRLSAIKYPHTTMLINRIGTIAYTLWYLHNLIKY